MWLQGCANALPFILTSPCVSKVLRLLLLSRCSFAVFLNCLPDMHTPQPAEVLLKAMEVRAIVLGSQVAEVGSKSIRAENGLPKPALLLWQSEVGRLTPQNSSAFRASHKKQASWSAL